MTAPRILLAEDDAISTQVAVAFLEKAGCTCAAFPDGPSALRALTAESFDLALLDMRMPGMGGPEVARRYRQWEAEQRRERLPVLALTANVLDEDRDQCAAAGMDGFITKPLGRPALMEALRTHLAAAG